MTQTRVKFTILNVYRFFYKRDCCKNETNTYFLMKSRKCLNNDPLALIDM